MRSETLDVTAAKYVLGLVDAENLPALAMQWIQEGHDVPALWQLASLTTPTREDAIPALKEALQEIGVSLPDRRRAVMLLALKTARRIVQSNLPPYEGANTIWQLTLLGDPEKFHDLDAFVYAASEWEDRCQDRAFFDRAIMQAAHKLLHDVGDE